MNKANEFINRLKKYNSILTKQQIKTLRGQAIKGEVEAAQKGLNKLLKGLDNPVL